MQYVLSVVRFMTKEVMLPKLCIIFLLVALGWTSVIAQQNAAPFAIDAKKQAVLSKIHKAAKAGKWDSAVSLAKLSGDRDLILFADIMKLPQKAPGQYDFQRLRRILLKGVAELPNQYGGVVDDIQMPPLGITPDQIIERYNTFGKEGKDRAKKHIGSMWRNRNMTLEEENKFYGRFKSLLTVQDNNARMNNLLWAGNIEAASRMAPRIGGEQKSSLEARLRIMKAQKYADVKRIISALKSHDAADSGVLYAKALWMHKSKVMYKETIRHLVQMPAPVDHKLHWWLISRYYIRDLLIKNSTPRMHKTAYILASKYKPDVGAKSLDAEWTAGWIALRFLNMPSAAYNHFMQVYDHSNTMRSFSKAAYWAGVASTAMKDKQRAMQWFSVAGRHPTTFYGQLALSMIDKADYFNLPKYKVDKDVLLRVSKNKAAKMLFYATILRDSVLADALMRVAAISTKSPEELEVITAIPLQFSMPHLTVLGGIEAAKSSNVLLINSLYPMHYVSHGNSPIDAPLRLAIIRQESMFNKAAVSAAGARGVMQLMPKTARYVANRLEISNFADEKLFDPKFNIMLGSHYLRHALSFTDNNLVMSLVVYNAGPGSLAKFVSSYGDPRQMRNIHDVVDWIESIPYHETRYYVQHILESLQIYRSLLGPNQGSSRIELTKDLVGKYV